MKLCWFEDSGVDFLEPIALTRPAFSLWCGARQIWQRHQPILPNAQCGAWIRPHLVDFTRFAFPDWSFNDPDWPGASASVFLNSRWLPPVGLQLDLETPHVGLVDRQIAYVVRPERAIQSVDDVESWGEQCVARLPAQAAPGAMLDFLWHVVDANSAALCDDAAWFHASRTVQNILPANSSVLGSPELFLVEASATVEPFVVADTRGGPVMIDRGAVVHSFSRLEGPCYIGPETLVLGAKIRAGTTLGPCCRVGGEVEASLMQGYSNKYHEGFLGHSYVGEWVNLAAATQTSDLRNDYGMVRLTINGQRMSTGRAKVGSYIGDHTKTGLGALLNTGSVIGAFANVLPSGTFLPQIIPSFCQVQYGQVMERWDIRQLFTTANTVMRRRGIELTEAHRDFFYQLYDATAESRRRTIREYEIRRMRRTV
jgi:UDP-N-acetylglucosamine diphosphorylase/glucosamine-1-phosphate N-acetyltransferase